MFSPFLIWKPIWIEFQLRRIDWTIMWGLLSFFSLPDDYTKYPKFTHCVCEKGFLVSRPDEIVLLWRWIYLARNWKCKRRVFNNGTTCGMELKINTLNLQLSGKSTKVILTVRMLEIINNKKTTPLESTHAVLPSVECSSDGLQGPDRTNCFLHLPAAALVHTWMGFQ